MKPGDRCMLFLLGGQQLPNQGSMNCIKQINLSYGQIVVYFVKLLDWVNFCLFFSTFSIIFPFPSVLVVMETFVIGMSQV